MKLHITHDDKFLDHFIQNALQIERAEENKFLVYTADPDRRLVLTKSSAAIGVPIGSAKLAQEVGSFRECSVVYLHFFTSTSADIIRHCPPHIPIVWVFWGGDAFDLHEFSKDLLGDETRRIVHGGFRRRIRAARAVLSRLRHRDARSALLSAMRRANYFAHYIPEDFALVRRKLALSAAHVDFNYMTCSQSLGGRKEGVGGFCRGKDVLVGNSADPSNNHAEVLLALARTDLAKGRRIVCPISYGASDSGYTQQICTLGYRLFGSQFVPLRSFMPMSEYTSIIEGCGVRIYNHWRSQAFGNIAAALHDGAILYMSAKSSLYRLLASLGFRLFTVENDIMDAQGLSLAACEQNRDLVIRHFGQEAVLKRYESLLALGK